MAAVLGLRLQLLPVLGSSAPYVLFYPVVAAAACLGGIGPGLLATGLSWLCVGFLVPALGPLALFTTPGTTADGLGFLLVCGILIALATSRRRLQEALRLAGAVRRQAQEEESGPALRSPDGAPAGMVGMGDMATRKQELETLQRTEELAATGRLAVTIAHEINNPLEAVTNLLYIASNDAALPEHVRAYLNLADLELGRVAHIAKQTLDFHRDAAGPAAVALPPLVEGVLSLYARRLEGKHILVHRDLEENAAVEGHAGELRQVVANLVVNAIDALPEKGVLTLRLRTTRQTSAGPARVHLLVADTGPGIPREIRERIFEPFVTTKPDVGTGLGLWVVRSIVHQHGGSVRLRSRTADGRSGSCFRVTLPAAAAPPGGAQQPTRSRATA